MKMNDIFRINVPTIVIEFSFEPTHSGSSNVHPQYVCFEQQQKI